MAYRSLLFVPGSRPDRFEKAIAAGADSVCIDLEDAVAPSGKAEARSEVMRFFETPRTSACAIGFRMNALSTADGYRDIAAFADSKATPDFLMIPKASGADELLLIAEALGPRTPSLWPLIETPQALARVHDIASAVGENGGVMFGGADYSAAIGASMVWDALFPARTSIVAAASGYGAEAMDVPYLDVKDDDGLCADTERVKALGFTGRACIHPAQVATVNAVFAPSPDDINRAERIVSAYEEAGGGVALLDGKLIEKPVLRAAKRTLAAKRD
ncbi:MAG: CoA ester lyase [Pseudomonadota bacterium]